MAIAFCLLINDKSRILTFHFSSRLKLHFKESKAIHKKEPEWRWLGRMVQNCNSWVVRNLIDFQKRWHMILSLSAFLFDIHMMNGLIFWGELGFVCILSTGHLSIQYLFKLFFCLNYSLYISMLYIVLFLGKTQYFCVWSSCVEFS